MLEIRTEKVGRDTAFGRIIEAVERAERSRAPIQRTADRLAGYLVYFALGCAALTFLITRDARSTISVIVVAGACGIAAGTPLAILGAIGRAARKGAIIKGGLYLEVLASVDAVVLDKTGTLTLGAPEVFHVHALNGFDSTEVIRIAATAERFSEHPLAKAILSKAYDWSLTVGDPAGFRYSPGMGIACEVEGQPTLVGTRALLEQNGLQVPDDGSPSDQFSEVMVAREGSCLDLSKSLTFSDLRLRPQWLKSENWVCARSSSLAIGRKSATLPPDNSAWTKCGPNCFPIKKWSASVNCARKAGSWRWWGTA